MEVIQTSTQEKTMDETPGKKAQCISKAWADWHGWVGGSRRGLVLDDLSEVYWVKTGRTLNSSRNSIVFSERGIA
jgi:hypothetical protein